MTPLNNWKGLSLLLRAKAFQANLKGRKNGKVFADALSVYLDIFQNGAQQKANTDLELITKSSTAKKAPERNVLELSLLLSQF